MSERGVFAVDRGIWSDPDFADEQFSEREAFLWLLSEAAWRPTRVRIGHHSVDLARGQCAFSTRFMAEKWKWSEARVRRYLGRLIAAEIICTRTDKIATHITIQKYDRFQRVSLPDAEVATHTRRTSDAPTTHLRRKEEDRENTSLRSEEREIARRHAWPDDYREQVWSAYGKPVEKKAGMQALDALHRSDKVDFTELIGGILRQAAEVPDPQFRPSLERFIKREKWTDQAIPKAQQNGQGSHDLFARRAPSSGRGGSSFDAVAAGLARVADRRGLRPGGRQNGSGQDDPRDHRARPDDPEIEDAHWSSAGGHRAAHH